MGFSGSGSGEGCMMSALLSCTVKRWGEWGLVGLEVVESVLCLYCLVVL